MSVEYYAKLERGSLGGVSASVLDAIARALQLDEAERAHLFHLAHAADGTSAAMRPRRRATTSGPCAPACNGPSTPSPRAPAIVGNGRIGPARHQPSRTGRSTPTSTIDPTHPPNFARFAFLDSAAHRFYPDWDLARRHHRRQSCAPQPGRDPHDKSLHDLVGELSTRSDEFRRRLERPRRSRPRHRHQVLPPPHRRRPHPRLRKLRSQSRIPALTMTIPRREPNPPEHPKAHPQTTEMTTAEPTIVGPAVADDLRHHMVAGAGFEPATSGL